MPKPSAFELLAHPHTGDPKQMEARARDFASEMRTRRTVRHFASTPVSRGVIEACIDAAGAAPSGANRQPWHFVAVSDPATKRRIREAAEREEEAFYNGRAPREWLEALAPIGTDASKPFLEDAPWLIAVFAESWGVDMDGGRVRNYYVTESVGISVGFLIAALHRAGLGTLTHTPSPMRFLNEVLGRPENERPFLLLVAGIPADDARVPVLGKKAVPEYATFIDADRLPRGVDRRPRPAEPSSPEGVIKP
ncbi:MAG: nitroreductase family protein [Gemmatimonadales bacterium]|nr:MAG: nitroreductase family protein [Gemmatimonadales bacterium]